MLRHECARVDAARSNQGLMDHGATALFAWILHMPVSSPGMLLLSFSSKLPHPASSYARNTAAPGSCCCHPGSYHGGRTGSFGPCASSDLSTSLHAVGSGAGIT